MSDLPYNSVILNLIHGIEDNKPLNKRAPLQAIGEIYNLILVYNLLKIDSKYRIANIFKRKYDKDSLISLDFEYPPYVDYSNSILDYFYTFLENVYSKCYGTNNLYNNLYNSPVYMESFPFAKSVIYDNASTSIGNLFGYNVSIEIGYNKKPYAMECRIYNIPKIDNICFRIQLDSYKRYAELKRYIDIPLDKGAYESLQGIISNTLALNGVEDKDISNIHIDRRFTKSILDYFYLNPIV